jgi:cytochrome P450
VFVLYLIAKNPRVQKRLYEEILQVAPGRCPLTAETLRQATYLQACIMEAFRRVTTACDKIAPSTVHMCIIVDRICPILEVFTAVTILIAIVWV